MFLPKSAGQSHQRGRIIGVVISFRYALLFIFFARANLRRRRQLPLRAAFWNIKWFPGGRPNAYRAEERQQIDSVQQDITKLNADVIGFEEVRSWDAAALAVKSLPGFKVDVCANFPPREGQTETQQVAITSRLQPMSAWAEEWKAGSAITPPRGFAFAAYQLAPKQLLLVYGLHLKSNRGEAIEDIAIREESMRQLARAHERHGSGLRKTRRPYLAGRRRFQYRAG